MRGLLHAADHVIIEGDVPRLLSGAQRALLGEPLPVYFRQPVVAGVLVGQKRVPDPAVRLVKVLFRHDHFLIGDHEGVGPAQVKVEVGEIVAVVAARHVSHDVRQGSAPFAGGEYAGILPHYAEQPQPRGLGILYGGQVAVHQVHVVDALVVLGEGALSVVEAHYCAAAVGEHYISALLAARRPEKRQELYRSHLTAAELVYSLVGYARLDSVVRQAPFQRDGEGQRLRGLLIIFDHPERLHLLIVFHGEAGGMGVLVYHLLVP